MSSKSGSKKTTEKILEFWNSEESIPSAIREIISVLVTVGVIVAILYLVCGTWPAIVTIESESMVPNMNVGDLVLVVDEDRYGEFMSYDVGLANNYSRFGRPGDVIIYKPNNDNVLHPIIHRALYYVEEGQSVILEYGTKSVEYTAPHEGYITKGDNNPVEDQIGWTNYRGLGGPIEPVKKEWIIGKAMYSIPLIGYLPLNIVPVIIIVVILMAIHELYLRSKDNSTTKSKKR